MENLGMEQMQTVQFIATILTLAFVSFLPIVLGDKKDTSKHLELLTPIPYHDLALPIDFFMDNTGGLSFATGDVVEYEDEKYTILALKGNIVYLQKSKTITMVKQIKKTPA